MKNIFLSLFIFVALPSTAQFSAYDPFDDNTNEWLTRDDDSASFQVVGGKLDMNAKFSGDYINAKGAKINQEKLFRCELETEFKSGDAAAPFGICWGASDLENFHLFYITASGKFGFKTMENKKWKEVLPPITSSTIHLNGTNWLRMNVVVDMEGKKKLALCINEQVVKTIDFVFPFGNFFGSYLGGKMHVRFDNFIVYQRGEIQDEFEPVDLSLSLSCKANQLSYSNSLYKWSCCVENPCRVDEDSSVTRFWYSDNRAGDYLVLVVPFPSLGNVSFSRAADQDFRDYMAEGDSITPIKTEPVVQKKIGNEANVYQFGEVYTSYDLKGNLYIRRYYVDHPYGNEKGFVFQFICSENSPYIPILDQLAQQVIGSIEFR